MLVKSSPKEEKLPCKTTKKLLDKRAENGTRTRDPNLGKVVLYQLSYFRRCFAILGASLLFCFAKVRQLFQTTKYLAKKNCFAHPVWAQVLQSL